MKKYLLYPLMYFFSIVVYVRNFLYNSKILPQINSRLPIISIGNIQAGGTGKTPFVIALGKQLINQNIIPIIITRGYKRNTKNQIIVNNINQHLAQEIGDEPYYIKQCLEKSTIIIDHNKKNAVRTANTLKGFDCIILDDGFQSRYINRNIDIALTSFSQINNFNLMPVGLFREPISSLKRADFVYNTKGKKLKENSIEERFQLIKYNQGKRELKTKINNENSFIIFSGIANPNHFISILKDMHIKIEKNIIFTNHVKYNIKKYEQLKKINPNHLSFITTYKDFVKLNDTFKNTYTIYVLEMNFILNDNKLIKKIKGLVNEN